jgi:Anti-sigma-K factor rskA
VSPDFDELVGTDLDPSERERLLRAHELLIAAGAPPELPPSLAEPRAPQGEVMPFFNRRRIAAVAVLAAALAAAAFGGGYLVGHHGSGSAFPTKKTLVMHSTAAAPAGAIASIAVATRDEAGNWQMLVRASKLPKLPPGGYYTLWLTRKGRPIAPCGSFVVGDTTTEVRFTVAYTLSRFDGWVVTEQTRGHHEPGPVLLSTRI